METQVKREEPDSYAEQVKVEETAELQNQHGSVHSETPPLLSSMEGQALPEQPELKIIRRKITGNVGFANFPKQWHRRSIRKGFTLNLLCVGQAGIGKSTLINTLLNKDLYGEDDVHGNINNKIGNIKLEDDSEVVEERDGTQPISVKIDSTSTTIEENGVKLKVTVIDTPGFGDSIDNTDSWQPIIDEVHTRFDQYLELENRTERMEIEDNRIHACLLFIEPTGHFMKPLDLEFCKQIHSKCNLIPVIAKSDILADDEVASFKQRIRAQLEEAGIELFKPPNYKVDDEETVSMANELYEQIPYAVVASTDTVTSLDGKVVRGRSYPWGVVEVDNKSHNDFVLLRDLLIRQYMEELRDRTHIVLYEHYRSSKLIKLGIKQDNSVFKEFDPVARAKEDAKLHEAKLAKLESEMKSVFQAKVAEKEKKLQKSESELFERHQKMKEKLTKQLKALEEKKHQLEMSLANQSVQSPVSQKKKGFLR